MRTLFDDPVDRWIVLAALASCLAILVWALIDPVRQWRARRRLMEQPTLKTIPTLPTYHVVTSLPTVRPAYHFDHSDTSEATLTYCRVCALENVAANEYSDDDGFFPTPRGVPTFCVEHAVTWSMRAAEENA